MQNYNRRNNPAPMPNYVTGSAAQQPAQNSQAMGNANAFYGQQYQQAQNNQAPPQQASQQPRPPQKPLSLFVRILQQKLNAALHAEQIDTQIARIDGKNKILDFSDGLVRADPKNYANIHGSGGHEHAPNSVIRLALTDYSNKGNSVYVTVNLDVYQIDELITAVRMASCGILGLAEQMRAQKHFATAHGMTIGWLQANYQPSRQDLINLEQTLGAGLNAQDPEGLSEAPAWSFPPVVKANPYAATTDQSGKKLTKVSSLSVQFFPKQKYQWAIRVSNFLAPLNEYQNGSITFTGTQAIDKKEAIIYVTTSDLLYALNNVDHFIWDWEQQTVKVIATMHDEKESRREMRKQANQQRQ